jgi:hypothetical protein
MNNISRRLANLGESNMFQFTLRDMFYWTIIVALTVSLFMLKRQFDAVYPALGGQD